MTLAATTSQTVGPYFKIGLSPLYRDRLAEPGAPGEHIAIRGRIVDAAGYPVPDALLEIWQADAGGNYALQDPAKAAGPAEGFFGFGRIPTDENGAFHFSTIKPGSVNAPDGTLQAPHLLISIFMRGLLVRLVTRIYFSGDPRNENDFVLNRVDAERRVTLMAAPVSGTPATLEWNVVLNGENETVFFDC